jgi:putative spermidine/putrescine transport system permease protein
MPLLRPAIATSLLLAFITSWDEVVVVLFVGGAFEQTLPVRMFEFLTTQVRPTVAAASGVLIAAIVLGTILTAVVQSFRRRRRERLLAAEPPPATERLGTGAALGRS